MASLTIRQLDDAVKASLRLRAAQNGRSMEDEVRMILRDSADAADSPAPRAASPSPSRRRINRLRTTAPRSLRRADRKPARRC